MFRLACFVILTGCSLGNLAALEKPATAGKAGRAGKPSRVDFTRQTLPLFADRCFACHGPDEQTREADLRLDLRVSVFDREAASLLIAPGNSSNSPLFERISSHDPDL